MQAKNPEESCRLFRQFMAEGDLDSLIDLYDAEAVFLNQSGEEKIGAQGMCEVLALLAEAKTVFDYKIRQIICAGDIALMHTDWTIFAPQKMSQLAIEVARR